MKPWDLHSGLGQLANAMATLKERWGETKSHWNDEASRQFEKKHLAEVPTQLQFLLVASQRLLEVLERAERDCEDRTDTN